MYVDMYLESFFMCGVFPPAFDKQGHVGGQFRREVHFLACTGVYEAQCAGMKCLTRADVETVLYELTVLA